MKKTEKSLSLLEQALKALPPSNAFSTARNHIVRAIEEVVYTENKKAKRLVNDQMTPADKWKLDLKTGSMLNPMTETLKHGLINHLDSMIDNEKDKLNELKHKNDPLTDTNTLFD